MFELACLDCKNKDYTAAIQKLNESIGLNYGHTMAKTIIATLSEFLDEVVKTITCDRGTEFANWQTIGEQLNCSVFFADPYCVWQKGTNENLNSLLREFYPKGRNLSPVSPATLKKNLALINARPKKILGFKKPVDLFELSN